MWSLIFDIRNRETHIASDIKEIKFPMKDGRHKREIGNLEYLHKASHKCLTI